MYSFLFFPVFFFRVLLYIGKLSPLRLLTLSYFFFLAIFLFLFLAVFFFLWIPFVLAWTVHGNRQYGK